MKAFPPPRIAEIYSPALRAPHWLMALVIFAEKVEIDAIRDALYASKIVTYAQGFEQMSIASRQFKWDLKLGDMATIWRGGCIIRARFLDRIKEAYDRDSKLASLLFDDYFLEGVIRTEHTRRQVIALAVANGVPTPAFSSALAYYDGLRRARGPANRLQGLRDYFGAHTYRRLDKECSFHTRWSFGAGGSPNAYYQSFDGRPRRRPAFRRQRLRGSLRRRGGGLRSQRLPAGLSVSAANS
jgi:6-phosphogluconate dehydrogenase